MFTCCQDGSGNATLAKSRAGDTGRENRLRRRNVLHRGGLGINRGGGPIMSWKKTRFWALVMVSGELQNLPAVLETRRFLAFGNGVGETCESCGRAWNLAARCGQTAASALWYIR
jgi:hypothetical protein